MDSLADQPVPEPLAHWRSWLDKNAIPSGWRKNLWDEFYALLHRREMFAQFREIVLAADEPTQSAARWVTQVIVRNHIEAQAMAIRRFADARPDPRVVSFGRILAEIAEHREVLGAEHAAEAVADVAELRQTVERVTTFADKEVAHLDRDHASAVAEFPLREIDDAIAFLGTLWERWYVRITGASAVAMVPLAGGPNVLRLERIEQPWERELRLARERIAEGR
jgi:hypothetical protein